MLEVSYFDDRCLLRCQRSGFPSSCAYTDSPEESALAKKRNTNMSTENLAELWLDRDLAWLEFNRRVLAQALDERTPLLERLKFLAIFTSNLDEFFMKR